MTKTKQHIKKVKLAYGSRQRLATLFNCHVKTVTEAANGKSNTVKAQKIRKAAVELGGDAIYGTNN